MDRKIDFFLALRIQSDFFFGKLLFLFFLLFILRKVDHLFIINRRKFNKNTFRKLFINIRILKKRAIFLIISKFATFLINWLVCNQRELAFICFLLFFIIIISFSNYAVAAFQINIFVVIFGFKRSIFYHIFSRIYFYLIFF